MWLAMMWLAMMWLARNVYISNYIATPALIPFWREILVTCPISPLLTPTVIIYDTVRPVLLYFECLPSCIYS